MGAYGGTISYATFDLQNGTIAAGPNARIESVGNGWYRCICHSADGTTGGVQIFPTDTISSGANTNGNILVWNCQYETGDIATPYIATTTAAVSVGPVSGLPRLDYLGSTCPRLLLEPQRTNLQTNSENGTGANWGNALRVNVTANQVASPDGYVNADSIADTAVNGTHWFETSFSATSGTAYTLSLFAKANTLSQVTIYGFTDNVVFSGQQAIFNVSNGTVVSNTGGGTTNVVNYGNGWYRVSLTLTAGATATGYFGFGLAKNGSSSYTGDGSSLYMWGIQLESGAYATSYIPTLGASVTRVADVASKTGISSLIGQTEGTLFGEFTFTGVTPLMHMFASVAGSYANAVYVQTYSSTGISLQVWNGAVNQVGINKSGLTVGQNIKFAAAYKNNDFVFYVNGLQAGASSSGTVPSGLSQLEVGGYNEGGSPFIWSSSMKQALLFKTRLTNSQLAELTA
jgi:hypothetical protein